MDEWTIVIMVLTSLCVVSGSGVFAYWLKLRHRYRHMPRFAEQLEEMLKSVGELDKRLESQTNELHERLDFAERLLTRGADQRDEASQSTPV